MKSHEVSTISSNTVKPWKTKTKKCYKNDFCRQVTAKCSMLALQNTPLGSVLPMLPCCVWFSLVKNISKFIFQNFGFPTFTVKPQKNEILKM